MDMLSHKYSQRDWENREKKLFCQTSQKIYDKNNPNCSQSFWIQVVVSVDAGVRGVLTVSASVFFMMYLETKTLKIEPNVLIQWRGLDHKMVDFCTNASSCISLHI